MQPKLDAAISRLRGAFAVGTSLQASADRLYLLSPNSQVENALMLRAASPGERKVAELSAIAIRDCGSADLEVAAISSLNYLEVLFFFRAESEVQYAEVRDAARTLVSELADLTTEMSGQSRLLALVLAADCAFFANEACSADVRKRHWLGECLDDLVKATSDLTSSIQGPILAKFASTTVAAFRRIVSNHWLWEPWAAMNLRAITIALDATAPGRIAYSGEEAKEDHIAEVRAELSSLFNGKLYTREEETELGSPLFGRKESLG